MDIVKYIWQLSSLTYGSGFLSQFPEAASFLTVPTWFPSGLSFGKNQTIDAGLAHLHYLEMGSQMLVPTLSIVLVYACWLSPWAAFPMFGKLNWADWLSPGRSWSQKVFRLLTSSHFFSTFSQFSAGQFPPHSSVTPFGFFRKCSSQRFPSCPSSDRARIRLKWCLVSIMFTSSTGWMFSLVAASASSTAALGQPFKISCTSYSADSQSPSGSCHHQPVPSFLRMWGSLNEAILPELTLSFLSHFGNIPSLLF